jgi:hypothetical protein
MPSVRAPARCTRSDGSDWYAKCSHRWPSAAFSRFATNRATISSSRARAAALVATYVRNRRRNGSCPDRGGCCWANLPAHNRGRTGLQRSCTNRAAAPAGVSCSFASSAGATPRASHTKSVKGYSALSYSCTVCTRTYTSTHAHAHAHVRHRHRQPPDTTRAHTRTRTPHLHWEIRDLHRGATSFAVALSRGCRIWRQYLCNLRRRRHSVRRALHGTCQPPIEPWTSAGPPDLGRPQRGLSVVSREEFWTVASETNMRTQSETVASVGTLSCKTQQRERLTQATHT